MEQFINMKSSVLLLIEVQFVGPDKSKRYINQLLATIDRKDLVFEIEQLNLPVKVVGGVEDRIDITISSQGLMRTLQGSFNNSLIVHLQGSWQASFHSPLLRLFYPCRRWQRSR